MDENNALKSFLATGEARPSAVVVSVVEEVSANPVMDVLSCLVAIGIVAKDLHYRAKGKAFYAIHELADIVWDSRKKCDELIEVYYLGECQSEPPLMWRVHNNAVKIVQQMGDCCTEDCLISYLGALCQTAVACVEQAKKMAIRSGTQAVLDDISKSALTAAGLLGRTERK